LESAFEEFASFFQPNTILVPVPEFLDAKGYLMGSRKGCKCDV
jgi:hypothetical protein